MATPTVQYDTKTGAKLKAGQSTIVNGKSQVAGSAYTGANAYGSNSTKVAYNSKTGAMLQPGESTSYAGQTVKQGSTLPTTPVSDNPLDQKGVAIPTKIQTGVGLPAPQATPINPSLTSNPNDAPGAFGPNMTKAPTPYQQGFANVPKGTPAPQADGVSIATNNYIPPAPPDTSNIDTQLAEDKGYQQLLKDRADFTHVANQQTSLLDFYNQSIKDAGIPAINTELLNTKKIIDGTEDDIRKEVQAVSGFATNSQVLALANARNKQLIVNYNNLLDTKAMAMENIKTMVGLAQQDQQTALQNITTKMGIDEQLNSYRDKFVNNANEAYKNVISAVGYDGLYKSLQADPSSIPIVEKTLGLAPGQLQNLASQPNIDNQIKKQQLVNLQLTGQKTAQDIKNSNLTNNSTVLAPYTKTFYDGTQYADLSSLSPTDKAKYAQVASSSGITPILDAGTAGKLNGISVSKENLQNIENSLSGLIDDKSPGSSQGIANNIKSFFGNADVKSFNAWRTAVINNVQALAGGQGSGLRINQAEIDTALKNDLPVITGTNADTLSQAKAKIAKLNSQLDTWTKQVLGGGNTAVSTKIGPKTDNDPLGLGI